MKNFFKKVLTNLASMCLAFVIFNIIAFFAFSILIGMFVETDGKTKLSDKTTLVLDLNMNIADSPSEATQLEQIISEAQTGGLKEIHLKELIDGIDKAAKDERINAIYMEGNLISSNYGSGIATLREVRSALTEFKATGKTITAYVVNPSISDFYLCSVADKLIINPFGLLDIKGMASSRYFLKNAAEKLGIGIQTVKVGRYKSAIETFTRENMSDEDREQTVALLNGLWTPILEEIAEARKIDGNKLQSIANEQGVLQPEHALELGLVDEIGYFDSIREQLISEGEFDANAESFAQISLSKYVEKDIFETTLEETMNEGQDRISVVYAEGIIVHGIGQDGQIGGDKLARRLRKLRLDSKTKAVVLRVNSPGGSALASELIEREIQLLKEAKKPVVVSMGSYAASGGYWIAANGDKIFAERNTITGSIGVFGMIPNIEKLAEKIGVTFDSVKTSKFADINAFYRPKNDEEMAFLQGLVDRLYEVFVEKVSKGRGLTLEQVKEIAEGRVWTGTDALSVGLVDKIGGLQDAISEAKALAGMPSNCLVVEVPKKKPGDIVDQLLKEAQKEQPVAQLTGNPIAQQWKQLQTAFDFLAGFNDPRGIYAIMPMLFIQ